MASAAELTRQGIAAANAGDQARAADLLRQATEADPRSEMAWLWRSSVATSEDEKRAHLQQALAANPNSQPARKGLALLGPAIDAPPELAGPVAAVAAAATPAPVKKRGVTCLGVFITGIVAVSLVFWFLLSIGGSGGRGPSPGSPSDAQIGAWIDCRSFVTKNLKAPSTAEFPLSNADGVRITRLASGRWSVVGFVDAQNGFGAMLRHDFTCEMTYSGDKVTVNKLVIGDQVLADD